MPTRGLKTAAALVILVIAVWVPRLYAGPTERSPGVTFSRPALYDLTHDGDDEGQLVDGRISTGTMWTSRQSVGWYTDGRPLEIALDLHAQRRIGRVCVRSARGSSAGVTFPARMDLFVSNDGNRFAWIGNAMQGQDASPGPYLARNFCSPPVDRDSRYLRVVVQTAGAFFFTDEIEVREVVPARPRPAAAADDLIVADQVEVFSLERIALANEASELANARVASGSSTGIERLRGIAAGLRSGPLAQGTQALGKVRGELLDLANDGQEAAGVRIARAAPYGHSGLLFSQELANAPAIQLLPTWHRALSAVIENPRSRPVTLRLATSFSGPASKGLSVSLAQVAPVLASSGEFVGDPLLPLAAQTVTIPARESRQVWLDVSASSDAPGGAANLTLRAQGDGAGTKEARFAIAVAPVPPGPSPSTVVWGYLNALPLRGKAPAAVADMLAHDVTTAVIPAGELPWPARTNGPTIGDYATFDARLAQLRSHRQFLFFMALNDGRNPDLGKPEPMLSLPWQKRFVAWIREWSDRLVREGYSRDSFAFYPVDEPGSAADRDCIIAISKLIKQADPRLRVYTTLHRPEFLSPSLIAAVDIFQLNGAALSPATIGALHRQGKQVWGYASEGGGKAADPATFYRAQGWRAFADGLEGFGFWAYADAGRNGSVWNDLDDVRSDYAVIYDIPGGLASSRRWEAWREGVQEYRLLLQALRSSTSQADRERVRRLGEQGAATLPDPIKLEAIIGELLSLVQGANSALRSTGQSIMAAPHGRAPD